MSSLTVRDYLSYSSVRMKKMASLAHGKTLDMGFAKLPNPYLEGFTVGVDLSPTSWPANYSSVVVGDVTQLPFSKGIFDTLIAGELIEHLEAPLTFLRDCRRLLRHGGRLIISTTNPYYPPVILLNWFLVRKFFYSPEHVFELAPRFVPRYLEQNGFELEKMLSVGAIVPLGRQRFLTIPVPRAVSYQIIYVAKAI